MQRTASDDRRRHGNERKMIQIISDQERTVNKILVTKRKQFEKWIDVVKEGQKLYDRLISEQSTFVNTVCE